MNEIWKDIPNHEGVYQASNLGNVRSMDRTIFNAGSGCSYRVKGVILRPCRARNGYWVVNITRRTSYVHRLVCEAFFGPIPQGMTVNHKDGDKQNNALNNLEIVTYSQNHLHAFDILHRTPTCLGKLNTNASKPVAQYTPSGTLVAQYPSAREAERQTGISHKHISSCCNRSRKTTGGFSWKLIETAVKGGEDIFRLINV